MDIDQLLRLAMDWGASDVHLVVPASPVLRGQRPEQMEKELALHLSRRRQKVEPEGKGTSPSLNPVRHF